MSSQGPNLVMGWEKKQVWTSLEACDQRPDLGLRLRPPPTPFPPVWVLGPVCSVGASYPREAGVRHRCKGARPSALSRSGSAPCCSSSRAQAVWPPRQASCRAPRPPGLASGSALRLRRCLTQSTWPWAAAIHSGVVSSRLYSRVQRPGRGGDMMLGWGRWKDWWGRAHNLLRLEGDTTSYK